LQGTYNPDINAPTAPVIEPASPGFGPGADLSDPAIVSTLGKLVDEL
jgi:hypothetical protein